MNRSLGEIVAGLSARQQVWITDAWPVDLDADPKFADLLVVIDDSEEPLPDTIADPVSGLLTPLGLAVRQHIEEKG